MGAFDVVPNLIIPDPDDPKAAAEFRRKWRWEAHEQVILRGAMTAGDQESIGNAASVTDRQGAVRYNAGTGRVKLLECMIVDWTLAVDGRKVEVSSSTIKRLPVNYTTPLLEKCDELASAMSEQEQEDFFASANGHSSATSNAAKRSLKRS